jgi:hypothetical protein
MMPISRHEDWVQIAALDDQDQIRFTPEFQALMSDLGWEAKAFVGHLLGLWYDPFEHLLDYTSGEATCSQDQPGHFDRNGIDEPQDVVEYWAVDWSKHGKAMSHLTGPVPVWVWVWASHGTATYCGPKWCRCACRDGFSWSTSKKS